MSGECKVSVIVPTYNVEQYIGECLDSLVNQNLGEIEIIVVDDGSSDASGKIADEYAVSHDNIKVIHRENGGLSAARNSGIDVAVGEFIYFLDSDDYLVPDALEILYNQCVAKELDVIKFVAYSFTEPDKKLEWTEDYKYKGEYPGVYSGIEALQLFIDNDDAGYPNCGLIFTRRSVVEEHGLRFCDGIIHEDNLYHYQLLAIAKRVAILNRPLHCRRYRSGSITQEPNYYKKFFSMSKSAIECEEFLNNNKQAEGTTSDYYISFFLNQMIGAWLKLKDKSDPAVKMAIKKTKPIAKRHGYGKSRGMKLFYLNRSLYILLKKEA